MRQFRIDDQYTSADMGLDIAGDSLEELFIAGAEGMFAVILGQPPQGGVAARAIRLSANRPEQLLIDWLSELLYLFDAEFVVPAAYTVKIFQQDAAYHLEGEVDFRDFDPSREQAEHEIKAVTYYKLNIVRQDDGLTCHVIFDL
jgi:SHS2 domain-containing protein